MLSSSILQNGSIANAQSQLLFNHQTNSNSQDESSLMPANRPIGSSFRRLSDELSMLTAERYADLEWPVKKALTFGYTNYASRKDLSELSRNQESPFREAETKEQLAKYYFKLFPFHSTANHFESNFHNLSDAFFDYDEFEDDQFRKGGKRKKANSRKLSRKRKGANSTKQINSSNSFKPSYLSKQSSIDSSSSSSSSSRRSSTDTTENNNNSNNLNSNDSLNNNNNLMNSEGLTLDEENTNGLSYSSSLEILNSKQDAEDENGQIEKEMNDEDFSILEELRDGMNKNNSLNRTRNVLVDRDLNDKRLLKSLMNNLNNNEKMNHKKIHINHKPTVFSSYSNQTNTNSIASLSNLSNSSESPSHSDRSYSNSSSHQPPQQRQNFHLSESRSSNNFSRHIVSDNLDLPNRDNELLDDIEDDDDNLDQYITTMSIIKKSRNVRHSKPYPAEQSENSSLKKDNDFSLFSSYLEQRQQPKFEEKKASDHNDNINISKKKRREMNYIEHTEMLPEPSALQSSSISNQWINSTSPPSSSKPSSITSNIQLSSNGSPFNSIDNSTLPDRPTLNEARSWRTILYLTLKIIAISTVILLAIFGNLLVIISVLRHHKLRITTNYFVVSLACADILVALFAMTFKASLAIQGSWLFGQLVCDLWNSCDVLFSTASIMHLCCISVDRYYAIIKPLDYPMKITNKLVFIMLTVVWISSAIISFIPIFTGIYTTNEFLDYQKDHPEECDFHVNPYYALISSTVSFWIPCIVMLFTYYRIFLEATRQEKALYKSQMIIPQHHRNKKKHPKSTNVQTNSQQPPSYQTIQAQANTNQLNVNNNNNNQINFNSNNPHDNEEDAVSNAPNNDSIADDTAGAAKCPVSETETVHNETNIGHNGARLSNTSTTTTVTTLSTSTTTTASSNAQPTTIAQAQSANANKTEETDLVRRKSSSITSTVIPNSQSMELKNSQINLSMRPDNASSTTKHPQPPTHIDIQHVNTGPIPSVTHRNSHGDDTESGQSTPTKRNINKMRREHKAAKTLGIIMGAFFICWLPFFTVYVFLAICGRSCESFPGFIVDFLFWVGYFNSSLNPIIYAYFNREFRTAFKTTIQDVFCCCIFKTNCMRYQLAGQQNPDRLNLNNGLGGPNYARRNTTASYTGQFSTTSGVAALGPTSSNNQLLSNSNLSMNSSSLIANKPPISNTPLPAMSGKS